MTKIISPERVAELRKTFEEHHDIAFVDVADPVFGPGLTAGELRALLDAADEAAKLRAQRDALVAAVEAKDALLACYRVGTSPGEKLMRRLDKARELCRRALGGAS